MLVFEGRGQPEYPEKNLPRQWREPLTNYSIHICCRRRDLNLATLVGATALTIAPPNKACSLNLSKNLHVRPKKCASTQKHYHYWWHILMVLLDVKFLLFILSRPLNSFFRPTERQIKTGRTFTHRLHSTPCG